MADVDLVKFDALTPLGVDQRLRERVTEAVIAQGGFRHEKLNAFLRERLSSRDVQAGALFSEPVVEGAAPYVSSGKSPQELEDDLLSRELVRALTDQSALEAYRFNFPAYEHQLTCWRLLLQSEPNSVLVSSGTGSGKTECFLVPLLEDLARQANGSRLSGVRAVMLYPLNALIASQEERLRSWTRPFAGRIRFGLYNGLMRDRRKSDREKAESDVPEQVLYRTTLRNDPPPILVTNNTMLEYMTIRKEDQPIVEKSRGLLRWIIIDEAHSYIGSRAAELSLLLRRVLHAFGVTADQVRFVATSATIGGSDEAAKDALQQYLADLAGVPRSRVHVVFGTREDVSLPPPDASPKFVNPELATGEAIAANPGVQQFVREAEKRPLPISRVGALAASAGLAPDQLIEMVAKKRPWAGKSGEQPLLPLRVHKFIRAVPGLWTCLNPSCSGSRPQEWPFGALLFERSEACSFCQAPAYELFACRECGEAWLSGFDHGDRFMPGSIADETDEFAAASAREDDGAAGEDEDPNGIGGISGPRDAKRRLIGTRALPGLREIAINPCSGELPERREGFFAWMSGPVDDGTCPNCHSGPTATAPSPLWPFRFGAPFLIQNATPTLLEGVAPSRRTDVALPADGRQILSFTDSRQGTARFAANIETMSERSYVRAFVYHAVQKVPVENADGQNNLEKEIADLRQAATANPGLAALSTILVEKEAQLANAGRPAPVPWPKLVKALADDPMINQWVRSVWEERDERFKKNPEAFARFLLLRELARRPRRANAIETLGIAKLVVPHIESLTDHHRPELFKQKQQCTSNWRDFLYFLIDNSIRSRFALNISRDDARWLLPQHAFLRTFVGPDDELQSAADYRWPLAGANGPKPSAVLLLEQKFGMDSRSGEDRAQINETLRTAWKQLDSLLGGFGQTYALDFDKVAIGQLGEAWLCPVTHRVLPRLALGRTPYGLRNNPPGAREQPERLTFPELPFPFPRSSDQKSALAAFISTNPMVHDLRSKGVWHNLHDRAATFSPYIRVEEHSAQQPPWRLREFEAEFKAGQINMLACSTTMEMGVDIGSVEAVLNTNVPPSIANYRQRIGRAGRRKQSFSSSLTLARDTPLDRETFRDPVKYLCRDLDPPRVEVNSERIVQRHVNALLLAQWFQYAEGHLVRVKAGDFFGFPQGFSITPDEEPPVVRFLEWLRDPSSALKMEAPLRSLTTGTALAGRADLLERAGEMFATARKAFANQWLVLRDLARSAVAEAKTSIEIQARRLCREPLLSELAQSSVLPGSGFPTAVVPFINDCKGMKTSTGGSEEQDEINRNRRYDYPSRSADIAIREYAPGAEVVIDGLVWSSAGVTLNWRRPAHDAEAREIQSIRHFWMCSDCRETGCNLAMIEACPDCGSTALEQSRFLEPAGFRMDWNDAPHADTDNVTYIEPERPRISVRGAAWEPLLDPAHGRVRASADGLVFHISRGATKQGYRVCLDCGRAQAETDGALHDHKPLIPLKGDRGRCPGNEKTFAITEPIALGYEVLTDVAELRPASLDNPGAAWALASAVREALARRLGIEARELGVSVEPRSGSLGEITHSLFLFDQSSGGAGYAPRLLEDIKAVLDQARDVLNCPTDCEKSCSACVLASDLYAEQEGLDRRAALAFLDELLKGIATPETQDVAAPSSSLSPPVADVVVRRVRPGETIAIFAGTEIDLGALDQPPLSILLATANRSGANVRLVVSPQYLDEMDDAMRRGLRNALHRHRFELWSGPTPEGANGAPMIALVTGAARRTAFFTRDQNATILGPNWGIGLDYPVVSAVLADDPTITPVADDVLERQLRPGSRVRLIGSDPGRSIRLFGNGLAGLLKQELEAAGAWKPGQLRRLSYSDRYVKSPLATILMMRVMRSLRESLAASDAIELAILTEPLRMRAQNGYPRLLWQDWRDELVREEVLRKLACNLGFSQLSYSRHAAPHGRKLTISYDDGSEAIVLFDQGFGYWKVSSGDGHDFIASASRQTEALLNSSAFVRGDGESYVAIAIRQ